MVRFTVLLVHPLDAKVMLPSCFLTVTVKETLDVPLTVCELGVTCICPLLLEFAVIVPEPVAFVRFTLMFAEPSLATLSGSGLAFNRHGPGVGVGVGVAVGVGVGVGYAVGVGVGVGFGFGVGVGVGVAFGSGVGVGVGVGVGLG